MNAGALSALYPQLAHRSKDVKQRYARQLLYSSEDILQDALLALCTAASLGRYTSEPQLLALAYTAMKHKAFNEHRRVQAEQRAVEGLARQVDCVDTEQYLERKNQLATLAVTHLPPVQQQVLWLRGVGTPHQQIAAQLGITYTLSRQHQHHAVHTLKAAANVK